MNTDANTAPIQLRHVFKVFATGSGRTTILRDISLDIPSGQFVSIVGPSGSGKSTLVNMITGIDQPTSGEVIVCGAKVHRMNQDQLARWRGRHVGIIFQFFQLLPSLTILENVMIPMDFCNVYRGSLRSKRAMHLLEQVNIAQHAHKLPNALSGGEQQRAAIARALANDPPLLVADEPTGNLDTTTAHDVFSMFEQLVAMGKTVLVVTHDRDLSARTSRVIHLVDGRIIGDTAQHRDQPATGVQVTANQHTGEASQ